MSTIDKETETDTGEEEREPEQEPDKESGDAKEKPETVEIQGRIIADALRIRSQPGTGYPIVGFYYHNDVVTVSEKVLVDSVYWGKTDKGWIHMEYIVPLSSGDDSEPSNEDKVMTVIADCLRVRKETSTDSRIAELLYYGDQVTVLDTILVEDTLWGKVKNGWICMDYVQ